VQDGHKQDALDLISGAFKVSITPYVQRQQGRVVQAQAWFDALLPNSVCKVG
jgi:hypothetical protein